MLHNPAWEPKPEVTSLAGLIAWLEQQPPEKCYAYTNTSGGKCGCLLDQYLTAMTGKVSYPSQKTHWPVCGGHANYYHIASGYPQTMGAALQRARWVAART